MDFELSDEQRLIRSEIQDLCDQFGDEYRARKDMQHEFGWEFYEEFADGGWCGVTIPEEYGGQGYGVQEASIIQQEIARSGAAMAGTSITSHPRLQRRPAGGVRVGRSQGTVPAGYRRWSGHGLYGRHGTERGDRYVTDRDVCGARRRRIRRERPEDLDLEGAGGGRHHAPLARTQPRASRATDSAASRCFSPSSTRTWTAST